MLKLTLLACLLGCLALASGLTLPAVAKAQLGQILLDSRRSLEDNPSRASDCFAIYMPQINAEASKYEAAYTACLLAADAAREALDEELSEKRAETTKAASDVCAAFEDCNAKDNVNDFFQCYVEASNAATKSTYSMSVSASEVLQFVQRRYADIEYEQKTCTSTAETEYVAESARLYSELSACLDGSE